MASLPPFPLPTQARCNKKLQNIQFELKLMPLLEDATTASTVTESKYLAGF